MAADFDAVVIGSGFGGAVTACRLAEAGYRVLVLERGRRWEASQYPRTAWDAWIWDNYRPETKNGWIDLRIFPHMTVAQGAGVGGGSLIYANISVDAKPDTFDRGWPREITFDELKPHYKCVGEMMNVQRLPEGQWTERTKLMKEAAEKLGYGDRFQPLDLAVTFDADWKYDLPDPHNERHSRRFTNPQGREQGTCVHLANCDIGCEVGAKNTLDLNYLAQAENHGADVRPLHLVNTVEPVGDGYRVSFDRLEDGVRHPGSVIGRLVIVAAGSLGSTELMLRCRDEYGTLPNVSWFLGRNWSSNGDFLTPAFHSGRRVSATRGPTISAAIDFVGDRSIDGHHFFIEDGGFPDVMGNWLENRAGKVPLRFRHAMLVRSIRYALRQRDPLSTMMPWFAQARDAANGTLRMRKRWRFFGKKRLHLDWDIKESEKTMNAVVDMHKRLAEATAGKPYVPPTWTCAKDLVTPHPLGGCNMGQSPEDGVVDHTGEVFGYRNLFVIDGAIIPEALGLNPSKTIAALAERSAGIIVQQGR